MKFTRASLLLLLLSSCSLTPDYRTPAMPAPPWRGANVQAELSPEWWSGFHNQELDLLLKQALASNNDVQASIHRIEQTRAAEKIIASSLWPALDATGGIGRNYKSLDGSGNGSTSAYNGGLRAAYELDLFGRNRSDISAARSQIEASEYDKEALALIVMSDTAQSFISLLTLMDQIGVAQDNLANAREVLRITQARFDAGTLSGLELAQQKTALANSEAGIASLIQQRETLLNQLAVLVGKPPQDFTVTATSLSSLTLPAIAPLQPAELLVRRPDIRALEAQLASANYNIGAARAAFFPNFQLSASSVLGASPLSASASLASALAASMTAPIFSGGALTGSLDLAKARRSELEENYKKTVLISFQEVQDALAAEQSADEQVKQFTVAEAEARNAYALVRQRFDAGTIDFLTLLDAQSSLFSTQNALISARQAQYAAAIALFKSLGGGWKS